MSKNAKELRKITLAVFFIAISVVIEIIFKSIIGLIGLGDQFGVPFYAIPLVFGGYYLGPVYAIIMGFIQDTVGFFLFPQGTYIPLFAFSAIFFGLIPTLFTKIDSNKYKVSFFLLIAHLLATLSNTFALWVYDFSLKLVWIRLLMIPLNVIIMSFIILVSRNRITLLIDDYFGEL